MGRVPSEALVSDLGNSKTRENLKGVSLWGDR